MANTLHTSLCQPRAIAPTAGSLPARAHRHRARRRAQRCQAAGCIQRRQADLPVFIRPDFLDWRLGTARARSGDQAPLDLRGRVWGLCARFQPKGVLCAEPRHLIRPSAPSGVAAVSISIIVAVKLSVVRHPFDAPILPCREGPQNPPDRNEARHESTPSNRHLSGAQPGCGWLLANRSGRNGAPHAQDEGIGNQTRSH